MLETVAFGALIVALAILFMVIPDVCILYRHKEKRLHCSEGPTFGQLVAVAGRNRGAGQKYPFIVVTGAGVWRVEGPDQIILDAAPSEP